ncbi:hypothetical protein CCP3SC5AM1_280018 [Gammaproteobacteria bacterium]
MNIPESILISILAEVALILVSGLGIWIFFILRRQKNDVAAVQTLIESIRRQQSAHLSRIRDFISKNIQEENPLLIAEQLVEEERTFYKYLIHTYLKRDAEAFTTLSERVNALGESYRGLFVQSAHAPLEETPPRYLGEEATQYLGEEYESDQNQYLEEENLKLSQELQSLSEEHESLKEEHDGLKHKLQVTLDTMEKMIQEYSNIYGMDCVSLTQTTTDHLLEALMMISNTSFSTETELPSSKISIDPEINMLAQELEIEPEQEEEESESVSLMESNSFMDEFMEESSQHPSAEILVEAQQEEITQESRNLSLEEELSNESLDFDALQLEELPQNSPELLKNEIDVLFGVSGLKSEPNPESEHIRDIVHKAEKSWNQANPKSKTIPRLKS